MAAVLKVPEGRRRGVHAQWCGVALRTASCDAMCAVEPNSNPAPTCARMSWQSTRSAPPPRLGFKSMSWSC
jgi:hypothetical protein